MELFNYLFKYGNLFPKYGYSIEIVKWRQLNLMYALSRVVNSTWQTVDMFENELEKCLIFSCN